ncbi:hypothetical protein AAB109_29875 (plasmid) [Priestia megaterium]|uniref:hypothetical protein n=1 Tax=Priestia megaterium TaxID=1404 RepID=UPI0030F43656
MSEREPLSLGIDDILENNHLIADFMLVSELRERLEKATVEDLNKLINYLEDEKNAKNFASILKSGDYKKYFNSKNRDQSYDIAVEALLTIAEVGKFKLLYKAFVRLFKMHKDDKAVEFFINDIIQFRQFALMEYPDRKQERSEEEVKKEAQIEFAVDLLKSEVVSDIERIKSIGNFTDKEIELITRTIKIVESIDE